MIKKISQYIGFAVIVLFFIKAIYGFFGFTEIPIRVISEKGNLIQAIDIRSGEDKQLFVSNKLKKELLQKQICYAMVQTKLTRREIVSLR